MEKIALFRAEINLGKELQPAVLLVAIPDGKKTFESAIFSSEELHFWSCPEIKRLVEDMYLSKPFDNELNTNYDINDLSLVTIKDNVPVAEFMKLTGISLQVKQLQLTDTDYVSNNNTVEKYVTSTFNVAQKLKKIGGSNQISKIAYPIDNVDYNITWNSNVLTDEEKQYLSATFDADIAQSNDGRICRQLLKKALFTKYYSNDYTLIGLHGNPASGKTKMVVNDLCGMYHIPVINIPCDGMMTIQQILSQVGPVNESATLSDTEISNTINGLKNRLTLLTEMLAEAAADDAIKITEQVSACSKAIESLANVSTEKAELKKTPSILKKCLDNDLPIVVFLDEFILTTTAFQNALAPIITDGCYKDGPEMRRNNHSVKWIYAWNPNTTCAKSWDQKFFDRTRFIQVEDVSKDLIKSYKVNTTLSGMEEARKLPKDFTAIDLLIDQAVTAMPEKAKALLEVGNIAHTAKGNIKSIQWFVNKRIDEIKNMGKQILLENDVFNEAYLSNVTIGTEDEVVESIAGIEDFIEKVNENLYDLTKGKDSKNPDRNSYFYISDRSSEYFIDTLFCFRNVEVATLRFIYDLIPGGKTLRGLSGDNSYKDTTPITIANTVIDKLGGEIIDLNDLLFKSVSTQETQIAQDCVNNLSTNYDAWDAWSNSNATVTIAIDGNDSDNNSSEDDILSGATDLVG